MNDLTQIPPVRFSNAAYSAKNNGLAAENDTTAEGFGSLLMNMLSSSNPLEGMGSGGSSADFLTPILLMLVSKLFGSDQSLFSGAVSASAPHGKPLNGVITQGSHTGHTALDFGVPVGTNVHSTMSGKVVYAGWNNEGYGNLVIVENGNYRTYYAHLSKIPVEVGQAVKADEVIGFSGNTGNSTGPHLHYEVRKNGVTIDPTQTMGE